MTEIPNLLVTKSIHDRQTAIQNLRTFLTGMGGQSLSSPRRSWFLLHLEQQSELMYLKFGRQILDIFSGNMG